MDSPQIQTILADFNYQTKQNDLEMFPVHCKLDIHDDGTKLNFSFYTP